MPRGLGQGQALCAPAKARSEHLAAPLAPSCTVHPWQGTLLQLPQQESMLRSCFTTCYCGCRGSAPVSGLAWPSRSCTPLSGHPPAEMPCGPLWTPWRHGCASCGTPRWGQPLGSPAPSGPSHVATNILDFDCWHCCPFLPPGRGTISTSNAASAAMRCRCEICMKLNSVPSPSPLLLLTGDLQISLPVKGISLQSSCQPTVLDFVFAQV